MVTPNSVLHDCYSITAHLSLGCLRKMPKASLQVAVYER